MDEIEQNTSGHDHETQRTSLDELQQLVGLRQMLTEVRGRSGDSSLSGRWWLTILLDAACEHAVGLCFVRQNLDPGKRDFDQRLAQLAESFAVSVASIDGWPAVRKLHRARNAAQHEGIVPSGRHEAGWITGAEDFIGGLVGRAFGVDINSVRSAMAVTDSTLRAAVLRAEQALEAGDAEESYRASHEAFTEAFKRWIGQHPQRSERPSFNRGYPYEQMDGEVKKGFELVMRSADAAPFGDLAEFLWFESLPPLWHKKLDVSVRESERALDFVLGWIVRWEAFATRYRARSGWQQGNLAPTALNPDHSPRIVRESVEVSAGFDDQVSVQFQLADLPSEHQDAWIDSCSRGFNSAMKLPHGAWAGVDQYGSARIDRITGDLIENIAPAIKAGMAAGEKKLVDLQQSARSRDDAVRKIQLEYAELVANDEFSELVVSFEWRGPGEPEQAQAFAKFAAVRSWEEEIAFHSNGQQPRITPDGAYFWVDDWNSDEVINVIRQRISQLDAAASEAVIARGRQSEQLRNWTAALRSSL
ncbi:MAG: hypothetical protein JWM90_2739 [Thermoleophilia bacterium]|nr:hypothetical protein [Thermoleophilia bacterium]